ncbi:hypothetical protein DE146DRAFT_680288 [Phaeosphaeria sp. MPI-PUGE-AT-0046c]|nr:hypothetical protein DE146DRAFT_680288 [Phaeosphaeria sp. MPI-PUGE-AT-0046c]
MSGYRANGAGSPYTFLIDNRSENIMHPVTGQAAQSTERQRIIQSQPRISEHNQLDYYKTCVSRKQRARRSETVPKFFCTVCEEPFVEKADWKRHEETFQERPEEFQCDNCSAKYFLDKDFVMHHVSAHGCVPCNTSTKCSLKKHVQESKRPRTTRSGWGCGFCCHFSSSWTERCNHIANHFDAGGQTMSDWKHSRVIYSLLQRPELVRAWNTVLESKQRAFIAFGWDPKSTGRVEGYPDSTQILQLQDELEYFARDQDPVALARKAFNLAVATVKHDAPPPVPPKDYRVNHKASLQDIMNETESWTQFVRSITNDEYLPTRVTHLESGALDEELNSWYDDETF